MFHRSMPTSSDRGAQIAHRSQNPTSRHMTDIRGAIGCYYCWLGQYEKCKENCALVHAQRCKDPVVAAQNAAENSDTMRWNAFAAAAPTLSAAARQQRSMFDERLTPAPGGRSTSAAHERRHRLRSLHEPEQFIPRYKHPRGSQLIEVTPYTKLSVAPSAHSYTSHRDGYAMSDSSIWNGGLVKHRTGPSDERSRSASRTTPASRHCPQVSEEYQLGAILSGRYGSALDMPLPPTFTEM
jgi:hypothetical protein